MFGNSKQLAEMLDAMNWKLTGISNRLDKLHEEMQVIINPEKAEEKNIEYWISTLKYFGGNVSAEAKKKGYSKIIDFYKKQLEQLEGEK